MLATGHRRRSDSLSVQLRSNGLSYARLGLIVPKRHVPRAVDRNRIKRLMREWFRHRQHGLEGRDVLLRVTRPMPEADRALDELNRLLPERP